MTKQEVITTLVECTERLGRVPSLPELTRMSPVNRRMVRKYFGSYARALSDCNLTRSGAGYKVEMADLFKDWASIARQLNKLPSLNEYTAQSQYSPTPFMARYAVWSQVPPNMKRYIEEQGLEEWNDVLMMIGAQEEAETEKARLSGRAGRPQKESRVLVNQPIYGPLMRPCPLIHGPVNEAGVIYLFGTIGRAARLRGDADADGLSRLRGDAQN